MKLRENLVEIHSLKTFLFAGFPTSVPPEVAISDTLMDMGSIVKIVQVDKESGKDKRMSESRVPTTAGKITTEFVIYFIKHPFNGCLFVFGVFRHFPHCTAVPF